MRAPPPPRKKRVVELFSSMLFQIRESYRVVHRYNIQSDRTHVRTVR